MCKKLQVLSNWSKKIKFAKTCINKQLLINYGKMIQRTAYFETLKELKDKNVIKMLTGVRRCGKSTVMQLFRDYLAETGVSETQIVFLNFENVENTKWLNDFEGLYYYIIRQLDL